MYIFLLSTGSEAGLGQLVGMIFSNFFKQQKYETDSSKDISEISMLALTNVSCYSGALAC
jgi:hypothetical protein